MKAIEESKIAIVILSKDYASSSWCLIELAKIIECMKKTRLIVLPVFHYVDPSDVRYQRGTFAEAFAKHEERFKDNIEDVNTWRAALTDVANLSGFDLRNKDESKVIEQMVGNILGKLFSTYPIDYKDLVGINSRMEKLLSLFGMELNDVRFIGIWGMGGMGKTTLAQVVYDRFHHKFEGSSFLANVRGHSGKHGLVYLQKQLLSDIFMERDIDFQNVQWGINMIQERFCHKRVLVILDDVDQPDQLEALAGEQSWFGPGSRIIITTRDHHLLISHQVAEAQIYKVEELNNDEALKLFSRKAFKEDNPLEGDAFKCMIYYKELGKEIVCGDPPKEAGGRSRLWTTEDVLHVLKDITGTKLVKGIFLNSPQKEMHLNAEAFSEMKNLRLLKINNVKLPEGLNYLSSELRFIHWDGYPLASIPTSFELEKLVELHMHCSLIKQLWKGTKNLNKLKLIDLSDSRNLIETPDFTGVPYLKELILRGCTRLYKIHPSLGNLKQLIQLDLNGCKCLEILPLKINLESLEVLDLSGCSRLKKLPEIVGNMSRLSKLSLRGCNVLSPTRSNKLLSFSLMQRRSPDPMGMLVRILPGLTELDLSYCNIQAIPDVLGCGCTSLETLSSSKFVGQGLWLLNCIKLVDCDILSAIARGHYQFQEDSFDDVIIPGSEIPIWFSHQSVGSSVNLPVPSDFLCNTSTGFVVCAVFVLREHHPFDQLPRLGIGDCIFSLKFNEACKEALSRSDANGFIQINFKTKGPGLEVTKCGAHLVYNGRCVITPYEDDLDDSAKDTKIQQSRDDYVGDELAGFSGEAGTSKSNDVDVPHPKRILFPNLIERLVLCFGNWIGNLCTQGQGDSDCEEEE
uniref:ADP-ribosyl cyclase/cyclic ADP-ribose hydrolase n=1 Tax=Fagus sylvatica TaxID=28930 RepID=A0A2N9HD22_FAGSY